MVVVVVLKNNGDGGGFPTCFIWGCRAGSGGGEWHWQPGNNSSVSNWVCEIVSPSVIVILWNSNMRGTEDDQDRRQSVKLCHLSPPGTGLGPRPGRKVTRNPPYKYNQLMTTWRKRVLNVFILLLEFELTFPLSLSVFIGSNCQFHVNFIYIRISFWKLLHFTIIGDYLGQGWQPWGSSGSFHTAVGILIVKIQIGGDYLFTGDDKNRN